MPTRSPQQEARAEMKYGEQVAIGKSIKSMPGVLRWFNEACRTKLFPQMAALFPALISDGALLRAHGIVILKYNGAISLVHPFSTPTSRPSPSHICLSSPL